jgi:hypothetical protein
MAVIRGAGKGQKIELRFRWYALVVGLLLIVAGLWRRC